MWLNIKVTQLVTPRNRANKIFLVRFLTIFFETEK